MNALSLPAEAPRFRFHPIPMPADTPDSTPPNKSASSADKSPPKFTIHTIDDLFEHGYFLTLLEKNTNRLFWSHVVAWRTSVLGLIGIILGGLGWFGINWDSFINKK